MGGMRFDWMQYADSIKADIAVSMTNGSDIEINDLL